MIIKRKLFARKDYEGLNPIAKKIKKNERSRLAKDLNKKRNQLNKDYLSSVNKSVEKNKNWNSDTLLKPLKDINTITDNGIKRRYTREEKLKDAERRNNYAKSFRRRRNASKQLLKEEIESNLKQRNEAIGNNLKQLSKRKATLDNKIKNINNQLNRLNIKKVGKAALIATPVISGSIYGIKKLRDKRRNKMIILRKLFSDKKGNKKKEVVESKEGEKNRHRLAATVGGLAGGGTGLVLSSKPMNEHIAGKLANSTTRDSVIHSASMDRAGKILKIAKRSMDVSDKISKSNMSARDKLTSLSNLSKAVKVMNDRVDSDYNKAVDAATKNYKKTSKVLNKKFKKSMGKRSLIALGIGTAAGIGMDQLIKHRQKKLGIKRRDD